MIIAQGEINVKRALKSLNDILKCNLKMKINREKQKLWFAPKDCEYINIKMDDNALKQVPKFKSLGSIIIEDGNNKEYIIKLYLIIKSNCCVRITLVWK